jgi:hypothetical protein
MDVVVKHRAAMLVVLMASLSAEVVWADAEEATLAVEGGPSMFRGTAPMYTSAPTTRPGGSGGVALTYGLSDLLTADVSVGTAIAEALEYERQDTEFGVGTIHHDLRALRVSVGGTARFGARWIPTVSVAVGYQHRFLTGGAVIDDGRRQLGPFGDKSGDDILAMAGVGLDYRLGRHMVVGVSARAIHAFAIGGSSFDGLEIPIRVSYSWYPGWFRPQYTERLDD